MKGDPVSSPSRHIITLFTFTALLPLVYFIPPWLKENVIDNHFVITVLALVIIVPVVSYIALPLLLKLYNANV
ncbi:hypothetical protein MNBD_GAMMA09-2810 [hydrothermal vent metagenome]|uniref:Uncharacterized protein n=1 Tax=hydrothermal vent metagenome TaxID=652676 RepID=A0A3B0XPU8_9ZZZZ